MARITGLGGVFHKVADPAASAAWYREMLGIGGDHGCDGIKIEFHEQIGACPV